MFAETGTSESRSITQVTVPLLLFIFIFVLECVCGEFESHTVSSGLAPGSPLRDHSWKAEVLDVVPGIEPWSMCASTAPPSKQWPRFIYFMSPCPSNVSAFCFAMLYEVMGQSMWHMQILIWEMRIDWPITHVFVWVLP